MELNTLEDIEKYFPDEESCRKYMANIRWGSWAKCPFCYNDKSYFIENGKRYKCANKSCYKKFSVTVKTILECTVLPLDKWFKAIFMYIKSRGRVSSMDMVSSLEITAKTEFFIREKIKFVWDNMNYIGKTNENIFNEFLSLSASLYEKFKEIKESPYYGNPYHVKDIDDISDARQYNILERYTRYYMKVYCKWIWIDFADPVEVMSEVFLYMKDNGIKEYNAESIIKLIQKISQKMWVKYLNEHHKYSEFIKRKNKKIKENSRINLTTSYLVEQIKGSKEGENLTRKEIRNNKELLNKKRNSLIEIRKNKGDIFDFKSHFD